MCLIPTTSCTKVSSTYKPLTFAHPCNVGAEDAPMPQASKQYANIRQLYYGDNLPILRTMPDDFVDLCYTDPPFNSNRAYNIIYPGDLGQVTAFEDTWYWTPDCDQYLADIEANTGEIGQLVPALVRGMGKTQLSAYLVNMAVRLAEIRRVLKPTGTFYLHCDPTAGHYLKVVLDAIFGRENFLNEIIWHYTGGGRSKRYFSRKHDTIFWYGKAARKATFNIDAVRVPYKETSGYAKSGITSASGKVYKPHPDGTPVDDVWDIPIINPLSKERLGFPTQKPLILLDRIVRASSNTGDTILDPFCGCGTAIEAAENAGRNWVGIDITYAAIAAIKERFKRNRIDVWDQIEIRGQPQTVADVDGSLLAQGSPQHARKEFEKFCVATIGGVPNNKMGADGGIDGRIALAENKQAIVSVKSGAVDVRQVRELKGLLTDKHVAGVFVTRQPPTRPMVEFANKAGLVQGLGTGFFKSKPHPAIQILTLEEILTGKRPELPYANPS